MRKSRYDKEQFIAIVKEAQRGKGRNSVEVRAFSPHVSSLTCPVSQSKSRSRGPVGNTPTRDWSAFASKATCCIECPTSGPVSPYGVLGALMILLQDRTSAQNSSAPA